MNKTINISQLHRELYGQLVAGLTSRIGDLSLAEDIVQDAFATALTHWDQHGLPDNPKAWLTRTAMNRGIDHMRRNKLHQQSLPDIGYQQEIKNENHFDMDTDSDLHPTLHDDMLRLIFCCCHPALNLDARVALALKIVCGLELADIARAFIVPEKTMAQRLVRAKQKIRTSGIAWRIPDSEDIDSRIDSVMTVIYLVFNEAYSRQPEPTRTRTDLAEEAIRMGKGLIKMLPQKSQIQALVALMLLQHSRRNARYNSNGDLVLLADQDRGLWDEANIKEGKALIHHVFSIGEGNSVYAIQAAIAALHADVSSPDETDWSEIASLYDFLSALDDSPVIALNHAVAVAERDGAAAGLAKIEVIIKQGALENYHLLHATHANFLRKLGQTEQADAVYRRAIELANNESDKRFLKNQLN